MSDPALSLENPFRPIYEFYSIAAWATSAALMGVSAYVAEYPSTPFLLFGAICLLMMARQIPKVVELLRVQRKLDGEALQFMTREELREICKERPDSIFLGFGFNWSQAQRQLVHTIVRSDPERLAPHGDTLMGQRWMQGLGKPQPIFQPIDHNAGHTLLAGTTRAGKTRMLDSLITQAVFRSETVIILDPKGDKDLMECARQACIADGRAEDFVYFHPAFPDKSWRIDPLRNFNRATELASRIASLIPSETGADPFTAFGQMQLTNIANGILLIDEKPTLKKILTCFEGGMPHLVKSAILSYCRKTFADRGDEWEEALKRAMEGAKPDINDHATRHARFYRDYVAKHAPSQELQGLISSFTHDATHYGKMIASLLPVLTMLTSGVLGDLLSPDSEDLRDPRPITDFSRAIHNKQVVYIGLDSLSDKFVGSAIGAMFLADLTAVAGDRYNYGKDLQPVNIYVDEAAELANDPFIAMLNKAGGSKARITVATQTLGDFTSRLGSDAKSRMVLGNLNNVVALRLIDGPTQEYITETFSKTVVRHVEYSQSAKAETDEPFIFSGTTNEALKETEVALVDPQMLGALPNLEFFARISGGRLVKARIPILKSAA